MSRFDHRSGDYLVLDGAQIYCELQGKPGDPALVFLHGGLGTLADFNVLLPLLTRRYRLIGIDSRGHGRSTLGPQALSYRQLQADVQQVIDHLKLERCSVIGFGDGGVTALRMAASPAVRIDKLVAIGTPWLQAPDDPGLALQAGVTAESWRAEFPETCEVYQALNPAPDFDALVKASVKMWTDLGDDGHPRDSVKDIRCGLLAARGDDDPFVSRAQVFGLTEQVKGATLLNIPFAGHALHEDEPELLMLSVNRFLEHD
jgi:valacyclovir hydrolase